MFTNAAQSAAFTALKSEEGDNELFNKDAKSLVDPAALDCTPEELAKIRKWARNLRIAMLGICTLMIITAFYNFASLSSASLSTTFLAAYLSFFACMLCCYECGFRQATTILAVNFGFLYNPIGRCCFLAIVGMICYDLSTMGIVCFALLLCYACVSTFVHFKHPQYGRYMRMMHLHHRATTKRGTATVV